MPRTDCVKCKKEFRQYQADTNKTCPDCRYQEYKQKNEEKEEDIEINLKMVQIYGIQEE